MDTICFGEALIDFKEEGPLQFQGYEGGAPMNVAIAAARLGSKVAFATSLSNDDFGTRLRKHMLRDDVDLQYVEASDAPSTLAFVSEVDGDAHFSFMNNGTADTLYDPQPRPQFPDSVKAIFIGSISLLNEVTGNSIKEIVAAHKARFQDNCMVMYDPNVRPAVADGRDSYFKDLQVWVDLADVIKVSLQDLEWLYPERSIESIATEWLDAPNAPKAVLVTSGHEGIRLFRKDNDVIATPSVKVEVKDTVGAGDTFTASLMNRLLNLAKPLNEVTDDEWLAIMDFAAHSAALNCTRDGANPPTLSEVEAFMQSKI